MSTEIHLDGLISPSNAGPVPFSKEFDRIRHTAADRPSNDSLPPVPDPAADHGNDELKSRREDIEEKHQRIRQFLDATGHDGVMLGRADSVAWFTSGELRQDLGSDFSSIILYINRVSRAVIADNVQSARVFEEELAGLGFQLKERPWYEDPGRVLAELCHNKRIATDLGVSGWGPFTRREGDVLLNLRRRLTSFERQRIRSLGRTLALAVEATCRNFSRGENEAAIAGHLAHRLIREGVVPVDLRVASDDRLARYRQPTFKADPILKRATIAVTGRRWGLCASLTRTVSFGPVEPDFQSLHTLSAMVAAACFFFSRPGEPVSEVFRRAKRIYEKFNHPHEWTLDYQGSLVGYSPREAILSPESDLVLEADMPICWNPSVGPTRSEDTVVVDNRGYEVVTAAQDWPVVEVAVKGFIIPRPGILER